jgi:adenosylcobinamide kinase / adenosylcobinamide-phosphate guanylyltransferase
VATAQPGDADMAARIARHRAERPAAWATVEAPVELGGALAAADAEACVVVDCLTVWTANLLLAGWTPQDVEREGSRVADLAAARTAPTVVVTNEVGMGVHPATELGGRYRDLLGRVNRAWADRAERPLLVVGGRVLPLADPAALIPELGGRP